MDSTEFVVSDDLKTTACLLTTVISRLHGKQIESCIRQTLYQQP